MRPRSSAWKRNSRSRRVPAFRRHLAFQLMPDFMLRLRAEFEGNQVLGTGPQPTADIVARDDKIAATIIQRRAR